MSSVPSVEDIVAIVCAVIVCTALLAAVAVAVHPDLHVQPQTIDEPGDHSVSVEWCGDDALHIGATTGAVESPWTWTVEPGSSGECTTVIGLY